MTYQEVFVNIWPKNSKGEFEELCDIHYASDVQEEEAAGMFEHLMDIFSSMAKLGAINADQVHIVWQHRDGEEGDDDEDNVDSIELDDEWSWVSED